MRSGDVSLQTVSLSEDIHRDQDRTCPHEKSPGNKICAKISAVPARPVGSCKQPGRYRVDRKCHRDDYDYHNADRVFIDLRLSLAILPEAAQPSIKFGKAATQPLPVLQSDGKVRQQRKIQQQETDEKIGGDHDHVPYDRRLKPAMDEEIVKPERSS